MASQRLLMSRVLRRSSLYLPSSFPSHRSVHHVCTRRFSLLSSAATTLRENSKTQLYIVVAVVAMGGMFVYKQFIQGNPYEDVVTAITLDCIADSIQREDTLHRVLATAHKTAWARQRQKITSSAPSGASGLPNQAPDKTANANADVLPRSIILQRGDTKLSGHVSNEEADFWFTVRVFERQPAVNVNNTSNVSNTNNVAQSTATTTPSELQHGKNELNKSDSVPVVDGLVAAATSSEPVKKPFIKPEVDVILTTFKENALPIAMWKVHVLAHRIPIVNNEEDAKDNVAEPTRVSPLSVPKVWEFDSVIISSSVDNQSFAMDPKTRLFVPCSSFVPMTIAPEKPETVALKKPGTVSKREEVSWGKVAFYSVSLFLFSAFASHQFRSYRHRLQLIKHVERTVNNVLSNFKDWKNIAPDSKLRIGRQLEKPMIRHSQASFVYEVNGFSSGKGSVQAQAVRVSKKASDDVPKQWKLTGLVLRDSNNRERTLQVEGS